MSDTGMGTDSLHMLHSRIESEEFVERYVRNQLPPAECQAFEEHFFECDECFEKLQAAERFAAGMRDAAHRALLEARAEATVGAGWLSWALPATVCVALILAGFAAWAFFEQIPKLRSDLRQARVETELRSQGAPAPVNPTELAEANVPLVMLQSTRAAEEATGVVLKPEDQRLVLWVEPGPSRYRDFRLELYSSSNQLLIAIDHLKRGPYEGLAATVPADRLPPGQYRIRLTGQDPPTVSLVGEYQLRIRRP